MYAPFAAVGAGGLKLLTEVSRATGATSLRLAERAPLSMGGERGGGRKRGGRSVPWVPCPKLIPE